MDTLWRTRLKEHHQSLIKYMRFIVTDHMSVIAVIVAGGVMHLYLTWLQHTTLSTMWFKTIICLIGVFSLRIGKIASFAKPADVYFLSSVGEEWEPYMKQAKQYSMILPLGVQVLYGIMLLPLFEHVQVFDVMMLVVSGVILKWQDVHWQLLALKNNQQRTYSFKLFKWIVYGTTYAVSVFVSVWLGIVIAVFTTVSMQYTVFKNSQLYDVEKIVVFEVKRQESIWRSIRWFTDVPMNQIAIKQNRLLDRLLSSRSATAGIYMMERSLLRLPHMIEPLIWQSVIGIVIFCLLPHVYVLIMMSVVVQYMSLLHMLGAYKHVKNMQRLMQLPQQVTVRDVIDVVKRYLLAQSVLLHLIAALITRDWFVFISFFVSIIVIYGGLPLYLSRKIDKMVNA